MPSFIYVRVSTKHQRHDSQLETLTKLYPTATVFSEKESGVRRRPVLEGLLSTLQPQDTLIVFAIDRLGRKVHESVAIFHDLMKRGVNIVSVREGFDCTSPTGKLMMHMMMAMAEFEHDLNSMRVKAGIGAKKAKGKAFRRNAKFSPELLSVIAKAVGGGMPKRQAAAQFGVSLPYIYDICGSNS